MTLVRFAGPLGVVHFNRRDGGVDADIDAEIGCAVVRQVCSCRAGHNDHKDIDLENNKLRL